MFPGWFWSISVPRRHTGGRNLSTVVVPTVGNLWTGRSDAAGVDTEVGADDGELVDARGNRIQ
jgi:hypothetical protein